MEPRKGKKMLKITKERENSGVDRLSCLPDSILSHILSFADSRSAVRTSLLSKRFRFSWTLSPSLDFKLLPCTNSHFDREDIDVASFESFVNHVLLFRDHSNVTTFRLSLRVRVAPEFIENCVDYAARHKVQMLRVRGCANRRAAVLPDSLIASPSLTVLRLNNAISTSIELPKSFSLPYLKVLHLKNFEFSDHNCNGEVFSGCPCLETLVLSKCRIKTWGKLKILEVNCFNLKNLEIKNWRSPWKCFDEHLIYVNSPKLDSFKFKGHLANMNFRLGLPCLNKTWIDLICPIACASVDLIERRQKSSTCFLHILRQLCSVRSLSLSMKTIEVLCANSNLDECSLPMFENLRFITFSAEEKCAKMTIPVATLVKSLKSVKTDILPVDVFKEHKHLVSCSKDTSKDADASAINIPMHFVYFLLESSPSAEFLTIEIPKVPLDEK